MKTIYDQAVRAEIRNRMSPPNRESVAQIARDTGITTQTLYNWRSQWQKEGQLVPATSKPPEQWGASDKLAAVIQAAGLSGPDLGAYCRERGLYPKQLARWRQAAEDANGPSAPTMTDHRDLQRKNQRRPARSGALNVSCRRRKKPFRRRQHC